MHLFHWALALVVSAAVAGCAGSASTPTAASPTGTTPTTAPPVEDCPSVHGQGYAAVDYVDFIQAFGRQYVAGLGSRPIKARPQDLGRVVLRSRCSLSALNDRTHKAPGSARDGDTAFLKPGTPIYALRGWSTHCRLAARSAGELRVYLAMKPDSRHATPKACALHH